MFKSFLSIGTGTSVLELFLSMGTGANVLELYCKWIWELMF